MYVLGAFDNTQLAEDLLVGLVVSHRSACPFPAFRLIFFYWDCLAIRGFYIFLCCSIINRLYSLHSCIDHHYLIPTRHAWLSIPPILILVTLEHQASFHFLCLFRFLLFVFCRCCCNNSLLLLSSFLVYFSAIEMSNFLLQRLVIFTQLHHSSL